MKLSVEQLGRLELLEHAQPDLFELLLRTELDIELWVWKKVYYKSFILFSIIINNF